MKSMEQMRQELYEKARWDGGYPKCIIVGFGIVKLVHSEEEEKKDRKLDAICWASACIGMPLMVGLLAWLT